jgi:hypothetical protein
VGENYRKIVKKFKYLAAIDLQLAHEEAIESIFKVDASIFLTTKEKSFLESVLPLDYTAAEWEYKLSGLIPFQ